MDDSKYPRNPAFLCRSVSQLIWLWTVRRCVLCGRRHTHGGGNIWEDPRRNLSHRVAHCADPSLLGYILIEDDPEHTNRMIKRYQREAIRTK